MDYQSDRRNYLHRGWNGGWCTVKAIPQGKGRREGETAQYHHHNREQEVVHGILYRRDIQSTVQFRHVCNATTVSTDPFLKHIASTNPSPKCVKGTNRCGVDWPCVIWWLFVYFVRYASIMVQDSTGTGVDTAFLQRIGALNTLAGDDTCQRSQRLRRMYAVIILYGLLLWWTRSLEYS